MSRKPKQGYYVKGHFVALGSEEDLALKRELKGDREISKTDLKRESDALQTLGENLLTLRTGLLKQLDLPEKLQDAIAQAHRITDFEGRRRHMQFLGKLMRKLDDAVVAHATQLVAQQHTGSREEKQALHAIEHWRERMIDEDDAITQWLSDHPETDLQHLRALVRQARKDKAQATNAAAGQAPRQSKTYRELFQLIKAMLHPKRDVASDTEAGNEIDDDDVKDTA